MPAVASEKGMLVLDVERMRDESGEATDDVAAASASSGSGMDACTGYTLAHRMCRDGLVA
jgi:hypothetical protein